MVLEGLEDRIPLYLAASEFQIQMGQTNPALISLRLIDEKDFPRDERDEGMMDVHFRMALVLRHDTDEALAHLEEALKRGLPVDEIEEEEAFEDLRRNPDLIKLLKKYDK